MYILLINMEEFKKVLLAVVAKGDNKESIVEGFIEFSRLVAKDCPLPLAISLRCSAKEIMAGRLNTINNKLDIAKMGTTRFKNSFLFSSLIQKKMR